jgi:hypothetical protein
MRYDVQPSMLVRPAAIAVVIVHVLNIVVHVAHGFSPTPREWWLNLFDVDTEANVPTLFSSALLLTCAYAAWRMALRVSALKLRRGFFLIATLLAIVATDESLALHERCAAVLLDKLDAHGIHRLWVWAFGAMIVSGLAALMIPFFRAIESRALRSGLLASAVVYVIGALGFEVLGQHYAANHGWSNPVYVALSAIEEFLEMCGPLIFLHYVGREMAGSTEMVANHG